MKSSISTVRNGGTALEKAWEIRRSPEQISPFRLRLPRSLRKPYHILLSAVARWATSDQMVQYTAVEANSLNSDSICFTPHILYDGDLNYLDSYFGFWGQKNASPLKNHHLQWWGSGFILLFSWTHSSAFSTFYTTLFPQSLNPSSRRTSFMASKYALKSG